MTSSMDCARLGSGLERQAPHRERGGQRSLAGWTFRWRGVSRSSLSTFRPLSGPILEARWNWKLGPAMETSKVTAGHGRRLNSKTKVTNMVEVKEEADHAAQHLQELTPAEMEAMWLQVKQEVKEEMDSEAPPSSVGAAMGSDGDSVKKEVGSEVNIKQEPVDGATPKRRRFSRRELQTSAGLLDLVAIKKEALDRTEVKQEADDQARECKQELTPEEMEALWLEIKQEIKEEMEAEGCRAGAGEAEHVSWTSVKREVAGEVKIKRELLEEGNQDGSFHDSQRKQPGDPATPKRRRLTRRDLETPAKQAMETWAGKQETSDQVKVKQEVKTETCSLRFKVKQETIEEPALPSTSVDIKNEVSGLATQPSKFITVKKELLDDMSTQPQGHPSLLAVKEEERVGFCRLRGSF